MSDRRPLVGRALRITFHLNGAIIELHHAVSELQLAEASAGRDGIDGLAIDLECRGHIVEIAVTPAPEVQIGNLGARANSLGFAGTECLLASLDRLHELSVRIRDGDFVAELFRHGVFVFHLCLGGHLGRPALDIEILRIDIHARGAEARVKRQRLIELVGDVQPDVFRDAAEVGGEVVDVPLE